MKFAFVLLALTGEVFGQAIESRPQPLSSNPLLSSRPPVDSSRPQVVSSRPPEISSRPQVVSSRPPDISSRPPVVSSRPPEVSSRPPANETQSSPLQPPVSPEESAVESHPVESAVEPHPVETPAAETPPVAPPPSNATYSWPGKRPETSTRCPGAQASDTNQPQLGKRQRISCPQGVPPISNDTIPASNTTQPAFNSTIPRLRKREETKPGREDSALPSSNTPRDQEQPSGTLDNSEDSTPKTTNAHIEPGKRAATSLAQDGAPPAHQAAGALVAGAIVACLLF
ncbi:hypothetical protein P152DRAFT_482811 [Eremomyces bilateralis CBS 781.70]|uniref:Uncharacterized protein n=1 Tax=Eremomyces bilateralis CBS 781.70 TaxID=1392243 RepID=A0A6G1G170_9PEZI|nr:uncharacterized protein P152DRAFT_482811 [Eremomyces bilateralis CBS 781.70]KAF1811783.1 hypothetical protein P152DRAFT_482811 [Eremomyces bilateralis CBS 781.70]